MSFVMFATWVLVGVLAGVLAGLVVKGGGYGLKTDVILGLAGSLGGSWVFRGLVHAGTGMVGTTLVALVGAALAIAVQRKLRPSEGPGGDTGAVWKWGFGAALVAAMLWLNLAPAQPPAATAAVVEDRSYEVTPASLRVKAGIVTGEVANLKVTERVEKGSDVVVAQAKLTGILRLKNTSATQTVRLVEGRLRYVDAQGQPIKLEEARTEPTVKFASSSSERLDPGQETTEAMDVDFPADALKAARLKEIRLELAYTTAPYRQETVTSRSPSGLGDGHHAPVPDRR